MSGTGNTYRVNRWIEEIVNRDKIKAKVVMIEDADLNNDFNQSPDLLVGLLFFFNNTYPQRCKRRRASDSPGDGISASLQQASRVKS